MHYIIIPFLLFCSAFTLTLYQDRLQAIFDYYTSQLEQLKQEMHKVDTLIDDSHVANSHKVPRLSQLLQKQRSLLLSMQSVLHIPYNLKSSTCCGQSKIQLNQKISQLKEEIMGLRHSLQECDGEACLKKGQMSYQAEQLANYLQMMQELVDSCQLDSQQASEQAQGLVSLDYYLMKDNLEATNWHFNPKGEEEYKLKMFELSTKYNVKSCPLPTPYVNITANTCFKCEDGLFNLNSRACEKCQGTGSYLNPQTSTCDTCPQHQYYNRSIGRCVLCVGGHLQKETGQCVDCARGEYFNETSYQCEVCEVAAAYDDVLGQCVKCGIWQVWHQDNRSCSDCGVNMVGVEGKCEQCPSETPVFSPQQNKCIACPSTQQYNRGTKSCQPLPTEDCSPGYMYSKSKQTCIRSNNIGICPPTKPIYNQHTHSCQACPIGQTYNSQFYSCE